MHALGGAREALGLATTTKLPSSDRACRLAFIRIVASSLAPAHSPVLLALEFGFPPICPLGGSYRSH
jgi:hypothetical protein